jgi:hypothetical protein
MGLELKLRAQLKLNLKLFLDMHMLRESAFMNVASGAQFYDGSDMSVLLPDTEAAQQYVGVSDGQIWQSPFRQWVYESGVPLDGTNVQTPPIVASGLYIEGAFRATDDATFPHTIDYINGRVIFDSPQPSELQVHGEFTAREVRIGFEHDFNNQFRLGFLESKYSTNPLNSMHLVYPSGAAQPFPAVFIEIDNRDFSNYQIGDRSNVIEETVKLHIWALDDIQRDNIVDILTAQVRKPVPVIDFNIAPLPLSGIFNTLSFEYVPYQHMARNNELITTVGSGVPVRYLAYLDEVDARNIGATEEYERARVDMKVKVYLNAPITPFGHTWGPITTLGVITNPGGLV